MNEVTKYTKTKETDKANKMIQVNSELYERLVMEKAALMMKTKKEETFHNVIAWNMNKANHLAQIMSALVRTYPEIREKLAKTAKELGFYDEVNAIVELVGKHG